MDQTNTNEINSLNAIGIFDSGIGGLSIAQCIAQQLPKENLIYLADAKYAPYGDLALHDIELRVNRICDYFIEQQCKAIVIACNTATVNVIDQLRQRIQLPIIGVEPAIKPAVQLSTNKKVALLVTRATAYNQRFLALVERYKNDAQVYIQPCPGLVDLIEKGLENSSECKALLEHYLAPIKAQQIDTIVLGCTHYPFVVKPIKALVGDAVRLIETAMPVSAQLKRQLAHHHLLNDDLNKPTYKFLTTQKSCAQQNFLKQHLSENFNFALLNL